MEANKESLIIYHRRILENKDNSEIVKENARRKLLKLLDEIEKLAKGGEKCQYQ